MRHSTNADMVFFMEDKTALFPSLHAEKNFNPHAPTFQARFKPYKANVHNTVIRYTPHHI